MKKLSIKFELELYDKKVVIKKDNDKVELMYDEAYLLSLWLKEYLGNDRY